MFHHHEEISASTGEPPTPPDVASNLDPASGISSGGLGTIDPQHPPNAASSLGSSRSLTGQEQDSGYEASPSSIADNTSCALHFFGEQTLGATGQAVESETVEDETEFQDCPSIYLFLESESEADIDEWDMCRDCNSAICCGCNRTDSSTTNATSGATAIAGDLSNCDNSSNSSDLSSSNRPSSLPIQIPINNQRNQPRLPCTNSSLSPQVDLRLQPSRSNPLEFRTTTPLSISFMSRYHPLSWPSTIAPRNPFALPFFLRNYRPVFREFPGRSRRPNRRPVRSRRRLIDSDASSFSSSEDDGPEDVFNMATDDTSAPSFDLYGCPLSDITDGRQLPDVVLQSSPVNSRRNRSVSVNLPPQEEVWQSIGVTLRRLSDQFQMGRELSQRLRQRRRTIGNINHRNGS